MELRLVCFSSVALALAGCSAAGAPPSLAGSWSGTVTCYSMDSPLAMTIDTAKPSEAKMAIGEGGVHKWNASVAMDGARAVIIKSTIPSGDAQLLTGTLDAAGNTIAGAMENQLCNKFTLTRGAAPG